MNKTFNNKGWFFVLPVVLLVAFNAIIPLMTVVNFSGQETFGDNIFTWSGVQWFQDVLHSFLRACHPGLDPGSMSSSAVEDPGSRPG